MSPSEGEKRTCKTLPRKVSKRPHTLEKREGRKEPLSLLSEKNGEKKGGGNYSCIH